MREKNPGRRFDEWKWEAEMFLKDYEINVSKISVQAKVEKKKT